MRKRTLKKPISAPRCRESRATSRLHTWDQRLQHHPHVHCVIAAGGLAPDHESWISSRRTFFLPVEVLARVFRGKFIAGLKTAFHQGKLEFHGHLASLAEPRCFAGWLRVLFRQPGCLLEASLRQARTCATLSRHLHPSRRHRQQQADRLIALTDGKASCEGDRGARPSRSVND